MDDARTPLHHEARQLEQRCEVRPRPQLAPQRPYHGDRHSTAPLEFEQVLLRMTGEPGDQSHCAAPALQSGRKVEHDLRGPAPIQTGDYVKDVNVPTRLLHIGRPLSRIFQAERQRAYQRPAGRLELAGVNRRR